MSGTSDESQAKVHQRGANGPSPHPTPENHNLLQVLSHYYKGQYIVSIVTHFQSFTISKLSISGVAKSCTSFSWGKGGNVTSARWQVTLCDTIWHVSSSEAIVVDPIHLYLHVPVSTSAHSHVARVLYYCAS